MATKAKTPKKSTVKKAVKRTTTKKTVKIVRNSKGIKKLNKKGLGIHAMVVIAATITLIGAAGFFVWQRQKNSELDASAATSNSGCRSKIIPVNTKDPTCVKLLQTLMKNPNPGPYTAAIDGVWGDLTATVVWQLQGKYGLTQSAVTSDALWKNLCRSNEPFLAQNFLSKKAYYQAGCYTYYSTTLLATTTQHFSVCRNGSTQLRFVSEGGGLSVGRATFANQTTYNYLQKITYVTSGTTTGPITGYITYSNNPSTNFAFVKAYDSANWRSVSTIATCPWPNQNYYTPSLGASI